MVHETTDGGSLLIDVMIGLAIVGLLIPVVSEILLFSKKVAVSTASQTQILVEGHSIIAGIGNRIPLDTGTYRGTFSIVKEGHWALVIAEANPKNAKRSIVQYNISLRLFWPAGASIRSTELVTSMLRKR